MMITAELPIYLARYIGKGCFIRTDNNTLAFVTRLLRPKWLHEGCVYRLTMWPEDELYHVDPAGAVEA